jgi:hypothetical protein
MTFFKESIVGSIVLTGGKIEPTPIGHFIPVPVEMQTIDSPLSMFPSSYAGLRQAVVKAVAGSTKSPSFAVSLIDCSTLLRDIAYAQP